MILLTSSKAHLTTLASKTTDLSGVQKNDVYWMQDVSTLACKQTTNEVSSILRDRRDNKNYYVARLADENCWMTQNLDLDLTISGSTMQVKRLDNSKVDFSNTYTDLNSKSNWVIPSGSQGYATQTTTGVLWHRYGCSAGNTSAKTLTNYTDDTYCSSGYEARSQDPGNRCLETDGLTDSGTCSTAIGSANHYNFGNYYNYPAATAGTGTYALGAGIVVDSICPHGWHMPYGGNGTGESGGNTQGGYYYLLSTKLGIENSAAGSLTLRSSPYYLIFSGWYKYVKGNIVEVGVSFTVFTNLVTNNSFYRPLLYIDTVQLGDSVATYGRGSGRNVRCVSN